MTFTNANSGTTIEEIGHDLFRISTPVSADVIPGGFTFNQILLVDEEPLLFHTGPRRMFPLTLEAVRHVLPPERLRWIAFSHFEADECGALNEWLGVAPNAQPLCSRLAAMVSVSDTADRPPRGLANGEELQIGRRTIRWLDAPHVPHTMECGYLFDVTDGNLLCGDLFAQPGNKLPALTESTSDIWEPSEAMRRGFPYAPVRNIGMILDGLARLEPKVLACMHGSSFRGDGGALLTKLRDSLEADG
jgi:flavorubredoxin